MIPATTRCVKKQIWHNFSKQDAGMVFLDKETILHPVYCNKIARTCFVTSFKSLPWWLLTFLTEEPVDRTKSTRCFLQKKCNCCRTFQEKLLKQASKQSIEQLDLHSGRPDPAGEQPCLQTQLCRAAPVRKRECTAPLIVPPACVLNLLLVPTCWQDLPLYHAANISPVKNRSCKYVTEGLMFSGWFLTW